MPITEDVLWKYPELDIPTDRIPPIVLEAMKVYGTYEYAGEADNPVIVGWANELADKLGLEEFRDYHDSMPWCSLGLAWIVYKAGYPLPRHPGWSQAWVKWGTGVEGEAPGEIGDIAVFVRDDPNHHLPHGSIGHAAVVIRSDPEWLHCIGCNQSDAVNIAKLSRANCVAVRRPPERGQ